MNLVVRIDSGDLHVRDGLLATSGDGPVLDATGLLVAPGLVDLQVNGAHGADITAEPHRLWEVAAALSAYGVTSFLPTVITSAPQARTVALETLAAGRPGDVPAGAVPLGVHFEGPMIAESHKGAHPAEWLRPPSADLVAGWSREAGVAMVTLAPELPGALELTEELVRRGVVVSIGHTAASTEVTRRAIAAGASCMTHLFNAMPPLHHRDPGPVGVALGGGVVAGLLLDGHHLEPDVVRLAWRALGPDRFLCVSDSTAGLGLPDGPQRLGDHDVVVAGGAVRLPDGTLAGSASSVLDCVATLARLTGCSTQAALRTATETPARVLGDDSRGSLAPGARGDLVLLTEDLQVVATVVGGDVVHDARSS